MYCHNQTHCFNSWPFTALCYSSLSIAANDREVSLHRKQLSSGGYRQKKLKWHITSPEDWVWRPAQVLRWWPQSLTFAPSLCPDVPLRAEDNTGRTGLSSWALHAEERWRSTASGSDSCGSGQAVKSPQQETKRAETPQLCYYHGLMASYLSSLKHYYSIISFWVFILL